MFTFLLTNLYARLETLWFPICVRLKSVNSVGFFGDELDSLDLSKKIGLTKVWLLQFIQILSLWIKSLWSLWKFSTFFLIIRNNIVPSKYFNSGNRIWIHDHRNQQLLTINASLVFGPLQILKKKKISKTLHSKSSEVKWKTRWILVRFFFPPTSPH